MVKDQAPKGERIKGWKHPKFLVRILTFMVQINPTVSSFSFVSSWQMNAFLTSISTHPVPFILLSV